MDNENKPKEEKWVNTKNIQESQLYYHNQKLKSAINNLHEMITCHKTLSQNPLLSLTTSTPPSSTHIIKKNSHSGYSHHHHLDLQVNVIYTKHQQNMDLEKKNGTYACHL